MKEEKNTAVFVAYDDYEPHDMVAPERSLLRAILLTALSDLEKEGESRRRAREYFLSKEEDYLFCFRSVCAFLEVDPDTVLMITGLKGPSKSTDERVVRSETDSLPTDPVSSRR